MEDRNENRGEGIVIHLTEKQMEMAKDIVALTDEELDLLGDFIELIKKCNALKAEAGNNEND